jgi:hypothetical protein
MSPATLKTLLLTLSKVNFIFFSHVSSWRLALLQKKKSKTNNDEASWSGSSTWTADAYFVICT